MEHHFNDKPECETHLPHDAYVELGDLVARLEEKYNFKTSPELAFWHLAHALHMHLDEGKK